MELMLSGESAYVLWPLELVHFKARVAVLILGDGGSPNHGDGFQIALAIGLRKDGKTQDPAFAWS